MLTVIIADGGREQLAEWAGGFRHLIELEGEPLLERTVRQFAAHGKVVILGEYQIPPAVTVKPDPVGMGGVEMLAKAVPYLNPSGRTNLVFGDVWFSDEAIQTITAHADDWQIFGRPHPSEITGTRWGEYFCITLYPEHHFNFKWAVEGALIAHRQGHHRASPWETYFLMDGLPLDIKGPQVQTGAHWTTVDDWTDDFDFIEDVTRWRERKESHG